MKQYVKCIVSRSSTYKVGKLYEVENVTADRFKFVSLEDGFGTYPFIGGLWQFELVKDTMKKNIYDFKVGEPTSIPNGSVNLKYTYKDEVEVSYARDNKWEDFIVLEIIEKNGEPHLVVINDERTGNTWVIPEHSLLETGVIKEKYNKQEKTMKKFKNKFAVTGSKHLLEAFAKELVEIGYQDGINTPFSVKYVCVNYTEGYEGKYIFGGSDAGSKTILNLPNQWDEALKLAKEEVVQELEFEKGNWYVFEENPENLVCCTDPIRNINYGFWSGDWRTDLVIKAYCYDMRDWRLATDEEVKQALINEAKKRGFVDNAKVIGVRDFLQGETYTPNNNKAHTTFKKDESTCGNSHHYNKDTDTLNVWGRGIIILYEKGKWAELKPNNPSITVNGYKAEFFDEYVQFGCARFGRGLFEAIVAVNAMMDSDDNTTRNITNIKLGVGTFTLDQVVEINNYYKDKVSF